MNKKLVLVHLHLPSRPGAPSNLLPQPQERLKGMDEQGPTVRHNDFSGLTAREIHPNDKVALPPRQNLQQPFHNLNLALPIPQMDKIPTINHADLLLPLPQQTLHHRILHEITHQKRTPQRIPIAKQLISQIN